MTLAHARALLNGKPGNSGENSNVTDERFIPVQIFKKKVIPFEILPFSRFFPKRRNFSVAFGLITSARLHVERKRKFYWYFVSGTTQSRSCFRCQKKYQYHLIEIFHRNFQTNGKRLKSRTRNWTRI